jgi:hypothetical protein
MNTQYKRIMFIQAAGPAVPVSVTEVYRSFNGEQQNTLQYTLQLLTMDGIPTQTQASRANPIP